MPPRRADGHPAAPHWSETPRGGDRDTGLARRWAICARLATLVGVALWLALTTPSAHAMEELRNDATLIAHSQSVETAAELWVQQQIRSAPVESSPGEKESDPLSVIIPLVLVGVWAGIGIRMFRRARHDRSTRSRPD